MASGLKDAIREDMNEARKAGDRFRSTVLSMVLSDIRNREIELRGEIGDEGVRGVLAKAVKQREEAAAQMREGGRPELAEKEEREVVLLSEYLPPPLSEDDVRALVREAIEDGAEAIGPIMGRLIPEIRGRFDGGEASRIVREELAAR